MTSKHNVSAPAETHANTYNDSGNKTAPAGNRGLTTKTAKESQVADIQHTQAHPAAHIFPMMKDEEYRDLKQSIAENGLREPVWVMPDGLILDGRNRAKACRELGVTPDVKVYDGDDPVAFVVDLNLHRRHLNESQRSMVAANIANLGHGGDRKRDQGSNWSLEISPDLPTPPAPVTQRQAAEMMGVGRLSVQRAKKVIDQGTPELAEAVTTGKVKVSLASNIADLPEPDQRHVIDANDEKAIRERYREIAAAKRETKRAEIIEKLESVEALEVKAAEGVYDVIVLDPPWPMQKIERDERPNQSEFDYPTMSEEELGDLEIPAANDAHIFVWTTQKFLPMTLRLLTKWGYKYVLTFVWHKPGGFQPIGLPQYNGEFAVYARKGSPKFIDTKAFPTVFTAPRGAHSEKPEAFYETLRRVTAGRRLDMFNRRTITGFDTWGNEAA